MKKFLILAITLMFSVVAFAHEGEQTPQEAEQTSFQSVLIDYVGTIKDYTVQGIEFSKEQVPLVVEEFLKFELLKNVVWAVFFLLIVIGLTTLTVVILKNEDADELVGFAIFTSILDIVFFIVLVHYIIDIVKLWVAPKVYLIEFVAGLVGRGGGC